MTCHFHFSFTSDNIRLTLGRIYMPVFDKAPQITLNYVQRLSKKKTAAFNYVSASSLLPSNDPGVVHLFNVVRLSFACVFNY